VRAIVLALLAWETSVCPYSRTGQLRVSRLGLERPALGRCLIQRDPQRVVPSRRILRGYGRAS
jgi:hypothetical protein